MVVWAGRAGREKEVVERIVALLVSLADLAERAAGRSLAVRWAVLWALWTAYDVARAYVADCACDDVDPAWVPALPQIRRGHGAQDALALALSLRTLALMLATLAAQARWLARCSAALEGGEGVAVRKVAALLARRLPDGAVSATKRLDTS